MNEKLKKILEEHKKVLKGLEQEMLEAKAKLYDKIMEISGSKTEGLKPKKVTVAKKDKPEKTEAANKVYEFLVKSGKAETAETIAKGTKLSVGTVKQYLFKFNCFENIRGVGYLLKKG